MQYSIEKYKSTNFSRDLSKKKEEELKPDDNDHISCQFKTLSIINQRVLGPFFTKDKEALL